MSCVLSLHSEPFYFIVSCYTVPGTVNGHSLLVKFIVETFTGSRGKEYRDPVCVRTGVDYRDFRGARGPMERREEVGYEEVHSVGRMRKERQGVRETQEGWSPGNVNGTNLLRRCPMYVLIKESKTPTSLQEWSFSGKDLKYR